MCSLQAPALYAELQKQLRASQVRAVIALCALRQAQGVMAHSRSESVQGRVQHAEPASAVQAGGGEGSIRMGGGPQKSKTSHDAWYDLGGWVLMIGITVGVMALARNSQPVAALPPAK